MYGWENLEIGILVSERSEKLIIVKSYVNAINFKRAV